MQINTFTQQYKINNMTVQRCSGFRPLTQQNTDVVTFAGKLSKLKYPALEGLTFEKYQDLSFFEKLKFKMLTPLAVRREAKENFYAARIARRFLDNRYGMGNYTVLVVGRSMASIGETMRALGRDVRFLPMSDLAYGIPKEVKHVDVYKKYLDSICLTRNIIEQNPNHNFLLVDYVSSGESLRNAHKFLSRPDLLGNPDRIKMIPAQFLFGLNSRAVNLDFLFMLNDFKKYSPVNSLSLTELDKTFERLTPDPACKDIRNIFLFNMMSLIEKYINKTAGI